MSETKDDLIARLGPVAWRWKYAEGWSLGANEWRYQVIEPEWLERRGHQVEPIYSASTIASLTEQVEGLTRELDKARRYSVQHQRGRQR
jgi:hypothetical protein